MQNFMLFGGFGSCMQLPLNHAWRASDNEHDRVRKNETMAFQWCTKFVADLDPGCCSLGAEGLNARRVERLHDF